MTTQDALLDQYLAERDRRISVEDELGRTAEELGLHKLALSEYRHHYERCSRYFAAGWLCGLLTAAVIAGAANLAYTTLTR